MASAELPDTIPGPALALGLLGVVPFVATAVQISAGWPLSPRLTGPALFHLTIYSGVVLSFLGGIQWGLALAAGAHDGIGAWRRYGISIVPALAAWTGLWLIARNGLLVMAGAFAAALFYDLWTVGRGEAPKWYGRLRVGLTAIAVVSLLAAAQLGPF